MGVWPRSSQAKRIWKRYVPESTASHSQQSYWRLEHDLAASQCRLSQQGAPCPSKVRTCGLERYQARMYQPRYYRTYIGQFWLCYPAVLSIAYFTLITSVEGAVFLSLSWAYNSYIQYRWLHGTEHWTHERIMRKSCDVHSSSLEAFTHNFIAAVQRIF